jgi:hypothetical protein
MKRIIITACIAFFVTAFNASNLLAKSIPDYSLSPAETAQQPSSPSTNPAYQQYLNQNNLSNPGLPANAQTPTNTPSVATRFMNGFCDPNFNPAIAGNPQYASMATCLRQQRESICAQFQTLPEDAKRALDQTLDCNSKILNGENPDGQPSTIGTCSETDSTRLQLIKKYWKDQNTARALLFLPDDVVDSSSKCLRGGR